MSKLKFLISVYTAKITSCVLKLLTKSAGTSLPGLLALKLDKDILNEFQNQVKKNIITVTGTNGKTTVSNLVTAILEADNNIIFNNHQGANMLSGITSALACNFSFSKKADYFVLESDEAYLSKLYDHLKADYLIVTNLFRDQLDRYGELDSTFKKINKAIDKNSKLKILLNADDPNVAKLAANNEQIFYGFEDIEVCYDDKNLQSPKEAINCFCGEEFSYEKVFYSHLGIYYCNNCKVKRPLLKYIAKAKIFKDYIEIFVNGMKFKSYLSGIYNAYNLLSAISLGLELNIDPLKIQLALDNFKTVFGRCEKIKIKNKEVIVQLIKNPVGAIEVFRTVNIDNKNKLLIILNDNYADGRDVSWIWDINFASLKGYKNKIFVSGLRAYDLAVRLKYAGIDEKNIIVVKNIKKALDEILNIPDKDFEKLFIFPTYTALMELEPILDKLKKS